MLKGLLKFDIYRLGLIALDLLIMGLSMQIGYWFVFEGQIPFDFQQQLPYAVAMSASTVLALYGFLGVYSRRLPQFGERDARLILLGAAIAEGFSFLISTLLPPMYWPYGILFLITVFLVRAGIGVYASYRTYFFPNWQLISVPLLAGVFAVTLVRLQNPMFIVPAEELPISRTVHALYFFFSASGFLLGRWTLHRLFWWYRKPVVRREKALLIGSDLELLMFSRMNEMSKSYRIVGVLDKDPLKWGMRVREARILGGIPLLEQAAMELSVDCILLLKDSLSQEDVRHVERVCRTLRIRLVRMGSLQESLLRADSLVTADLLERKEYRYLPQDGENYLQEKVVMVTGAGGSIGSELVRQILQCGPKSVILLGRGENSIFELEKELVASGVQETTQSVIVNIVDRDGLDCVFRKHKPQIVFHAAAHKHVPLMEHSPREALQNNVLGTWNVAECAGQYGVERFVMISTDKAVAPKSVMGATKRKAEQVIYQVSQQFPDTQYSVVRFGNVLGSRGSVVRLFLEQIRQGGPVTVTDPRMTRYFMTIPEAVSLVLASGGLRRSFGIYVLDMGTPYKIVDLAEKMIRLCGLEPGRDIRIEFTGVRPGEKIDEILVQDGEDLVATEIPLVQCVREVHVREPLERFSLESLLQEKEDSIREFLLNKGNS